MQIIHDKDGMQFYTPLGENEAELTYTCTEDGILDFDYTFIPESHRGQGIADHLVKAALDHARDRKAGSSPPAR